MTSCSTIYAKSLYFRSLTYYCQITEYQVLVISSPNSIQWSSEHKIDKGIIEGKRIVLQVGRAISILSLIADTFGDYKLTEIKRIQLEFDVACFCVSERYV